MEILVSTRVVLALVVVAVIVGGMRLVNAVGSGTATHASTSTPTVEQTVAGHAVRVGPDWRSLDRGRDYAVWGDALRKHTVTLGWAPASDASLVEVVASAARGIPASIPAARKIATRPVDDGYEISMEVPEDGAIVHLRQIWSRNQSTRLDAVATWSSADGDWPIPPSAGYSQGA
jgi:hypothetical protein